MPRDLGSFAASMGRMPQLLNEAQATGVRKAALHTTQKVRAEIRSATGGSMRLSGVGKRGAKVGARFDVKGSTNPTALIRANGPIQLIERDTSAHTILPRSGRRGKGRRRLRGAKALKIGGRFAASAQHPGTRGKHPFAEGVDAAKGDTGPIFQAEVRRALGREFGA